MLHSNRFAFGNTMKHYNKYSYKYNIKKIQYYKSNTKKNPALPKP